MAKSTKSCTRMANDIKRLAAVVASSTLEGRLAVSASSYGPANREVVVHLKCTRKAESMPGGCGSIEIRRTGPGVAAFGLKPRADVGNIYGYATQISRDLAKVWGKCSPSPTPGFDGPRKRKRRRRQL